LNGFFNSIDKSHINVEIKGWGGVAQASANPVPPLPKKRLKLVNEYREQNNLRLKKSQSLRMNFLVNLRPLPCIFESFSTKFW
jgi:hypothetical protein